MSPINATRFHSSGGSSILPFRNCPDSEPAAMFFLRTIRPLYFGPIPAGRHRSAIAKMWSAIETLMSPRRELETLMALNDASLRDIGVDRSDLEARSLCWQLKQLPSR